MLLRRQLLLDALRACVTACNEYFSGSLNGPAVSARVRGTRLSRDCADLRQLAAAFVSRSSEHMRFVLHECAELCRACADESSQYSEARSRRCTEACRQAEDASCMAY